MKPSDWFSPPVPVRDFNHAGRTLNVSNVPRAAEVLIHPDWPEKGPAWRVAVESCLKAGEGEATAADVRKAFEAAAKEACMLRGA